MSTVTIPRPDVTTEDVAAALRKDLGPHSRGHPTPAGPTPLSWAPAPAASSGFSSTSTTAAAGPASGFSRPA
jgi:hypothetical protein